MTRRRGLSIRLRLTLSYAGFVLLVGIALGVLGFLVLRFVPEDYGYSLAGVPAPNREALLRVAVGYAAWALVGLAVAGVSGGWLLAGWMLRPLRRIEDVVSRTHAGVFDGRIRLPGAANELTLVADAFDEMLDRVEHAIAAERHLAANASHELRTPLAVTRTLLEVARANPAGRDIDLLLERLTLTNDRSIALTDGTLALARVNTDALEKEDIDLHHIVKTVIEEVHDRANERDISLESSLKSVLVRAHPALMMQMIGNIIRNAVIHNVTGGTVDIHLGDDHGSVVFVVENTGTVIDEPTAQTLTEPFTRATGRTRQRDAGSGLRLAIVSAVVDAHDGQLHLSGLPGGGMRVATRLPRQ